MGREDPFEVQNSLRRHEIGGADRALLNAFGAQVVVDFWTQLALSGYLYHMQIGTENAPVNSTAALDDELVWLLVDQTAGVLIPALYEINVANWATGTLAEAMLEVDSAKNRYTSGGTAFVPEPLNNRDYRVFSGDAYVGTDIVAEAKTAVPGSIELARKVFSEDAIATAVGSDFPPAVVYSAQNRPIAVQQGTVSLLGHFGAATADVSGYGVLQFAQIPAELVPTA